LASDASVIGADGEVLGGVDGVDVNGDGDVVTLLEVGGGGQDDVGERGGVGHHLVVHDGEQVLPGQTGQDRLLVRRVEEQEKTKGGIIIPDAAKERPLEGNVVAVGSGKRLEDGTLIALDVKAGDRVLFGKYSGTEIKVDGVDHIILREDEVLGILE